MQENKVCPTSPQQIKSERGTFPHMNGEKLIMEHAHARTIDKGTREYPRFDVSSTPDKYGCRLVPPKNRTFLGYPRKYSLSVCTLSFVFDEEYPRMTPRVPGIIDAYIKKKIKKNT